MTDDYSEPKSLEQCIAALPDDKYLELQKLLPGLPARDHIISCGVSVDGEHVIITYSKPIESLRMTTEMARCIALDLLAKVRSIINAAVEAAGEEQKPIDEPHVESQPEKELTT